MEETMLRLDHIESGIELMNSTLKWIKTPADKASLKQLKESLSVLKKKLKMLKKDEALQAQYLDRTCYDTVQGVFQTLHLYIISTDGDEDEIAVGNVLTWLRSHETAYDISKRMQANAEKRADFAGAK
jgi:hypothetical protein